MPTSLLIIYSQLYDAVALKMLKYRGREMHDVFIHTHARALVCVSVRVIYYHFYNKNSGNNFNLINDN